MDNIEDFVIPELYTKTDADKESILLASPVENKHTDWEKECMSGFKDNLREFLCPLQNSRCAYCRMKIHANEATPEVEHIVPKSLKPKWMYEPFNLCLSCKLCNTKKGHSKPVLRNNDIDLLPTNSDDYLLVHPYIDRYSEHIELIDGILYHGLTDKGRYTIQLCRLDRFELAAERASLLISKGAATYESLFLMLITGENSKLIDNLDKLLKRIKEAIREYMISPHS